MPKNPDGDTIRVLVGKEERRVRLEGIDCPERGQPFGQAAKKFASDLCFGKDVRVVLSGQDRYQRDLGDVIVNGKSLNRELLRAGLAWHYKQYNKDPDLAGLEQQARADARGLWTEPSPVPPWEWRRNKGQGRNSSE